MSLPLFVCTLNEDRFPGERWVTYFWKEVSRPIKFGNLFHSLQNIRILTFSIINWIRFKYSGMTNPIEARFYLYSLFVSTSTFYYPVIVWVFSLREQKKSITDINTLIYEYMDSLEKHQNMMINQINKWKRAQRKNKDIKHFEIVIITTQVCLFLIKDAFEYNWKCKFQILKKSYNLKSNAFF